MPILCLSHFFWLQNYWRFLTKPVLLGFSGVCTLSTEGQIGELCVGLDCDVDWEEGTLWCLPSSADQMGMILKSSELLIVLVPHFQSQLQSYIAQYDEMKGRIWFAVVMWLQDVFPVSPPPGEAERKWVWVTLVEKMRRLLENTEPAALRKRSAIA